jgi:hypothetical protein
MVLVSIPPKEVSKWVQAYRNGIATSIVVLFNVRSIGNLRQGSILDRSNEKQKSAEVFGECFLLSLKEEMKNQKQF